jgi:hypothetical protein
VSKVEGRKGDSRAANGGDEDGLAPGKDRRSHEGHQDPHRYGEAPQSGQPLDTAQADNCQSEDERYGDEDASAIAIRIVVTEQGIGLLDHIENDTIAHSEGGSCGVVVELLCGYVPVISFENNCATLELSGEATGSGVYLGNGRPHDRVGKPERGPIESGAIARP